MLFLETNTEEAVSTVEKVTEDVTAQTKSLLHIDDLAKLLTWTNLIKWSISILTILAFFVLYKLIKRAIKKHAETKFQKHTTMIITKTISYTYYALMFMYVLSLFGINLSAVWGAAGVAGLAIGFAAQTTISNLISGVFVLSEKVMKVGDYISIGSTNGIVDSVGLLSVKVHTLDNQMVRIANSTIINNSLMNYSHFPKRRFVFELPISYDSDMEAALKAAKKIPSMCPSVLKDPEPVAFFDGFNSAVTLRLAVWFNSSDLIKVKNEVYISTVKAFNEAGVTIPFTRYDVKLVTDDDKKKSPAKPKAAEKKTAVKKTTKK